MKSINNKIILVAVLSNIHSFDKSGSSMLSVVPEYMLLNLGKLAESIRPGARIEVATDKETYDRFPKELALISANVIILPTTSAEKGLVKYTDEDISTVIKNEDFNKITFVIGTQALHHSMIEVADAVLFFKSTTIDPQRSEEFVYPAPTKGHLGQVYERELLEFFEPKMDERIYHIQMFVFSKGFLLTDEEVKSIGTVCTNCGTVHVPMVYKDGHEPQYATIGSAGADLFADIYADKIVLQPMKRILIPTGIQVQLPEGYELQIRPKSGLAHKHGVTVLNGPGTIDCDYTGVVSVILINLGEEDFIIEKGMKIAQAVLAKYERMNPVRVEDDTHFVITDRGDGGFGSTGK